MTGMKGNMCERKEKERIGKCYAFEKGAREEKEKGEEDDKHYVL